MYNPRTKFLFVFFLAILVTTKIQSQVTLNSKNEETMQFAFRSESNTLYLQGNEEEFKRLYSFVDQHLTAITLGQMPIYIDGYCASAKSRKENLQIAFIRSNRVKSELIVNKGLLEEHFITQNHTTDYNGIKDIVIVTFRIQELSTPTPVIEEPDTIIQENPLIESEKTVCENIPAGETNEEPIVLQSARHIIDIRTNLLYNAFITPTLGIEWHINKSIGIKVDGSYAFWGNEHGRVHKLWIVSPEIRWYINKTPRFYWGIGSTIGEFNIYKGIVGNMVSGQTGYQGKLLGGCLTVGYMLKLSRVFSLDFNIGLGYTHLKYDTFSLSNEIRVKKAKDITKNIWGPSQAGISFVWHFIR